MLNVIVTKGRSGATCRCVVCSAFYDVANRQSAAITLAGDQCEKCRRKANAKPTQEMLNEVLDYSIITGELRWKRDFLKREGGTTATTWEASGYGWVQLDKPYQAHRLIWLMITGEEPDVIDHANHIRSNNAWHNLSNGTIQDNNRNASKNINNSSGYTGVSYLKATGRWRAYITLNGEYTFLGSYETPEEARDARTRANKLYGFHENHGK